MLRPPSANVSFITATPTALFPLPLAMCFACGSSVDQPLQVDDDGVWVTLESIDAGDGRSVREFVQEELSFTVDVDWSFVNVAELPADSVTVVPGEVASEGVLFAADDTAEQD